MWLVCQIKILLKNYILKSLIRFKKNENILERATLVYLHLKRGHMLYIYPLSKEIEERYVLIKHL